MVDSRPDSNYLHAKLQGKILEFHSLHGDETITISREISFDVVKILKEDPKLDFNFLTDITAVDYLGKKDPRFEIVYHFFSLKKRHRLRVKIPIPENDLVVASLTSLWRGADWLEREVWDLFGIRFEGHADLSRILLYEEFKGHPLRKDYPINKRQPLIGPLN